MVNGQFRCIGSTQHLKSKFGKGYTLMVKIKNADEHGASSVVRKIRRFVETTFSGSVLKDVHQGLIHFHLTDSSLRLGKVFGVAESMRSAFGVEDYSISQTTLEQVFISFAQSQIEPDDVRRLTCTDLWASVHRCVCCCVFPQQVPSIPNSPMIVDC